MKQLSIFVFVYFITCSNYAQPSLNQTKEAQPPVDDTKLIKYNDTQAIYEVYELVKNSKELNKIVIEGMVKFKVSIFTGSFLPNNSGFDYPGQICKFRPN